MHSKQIFGISLMLVLQAACSPKVHSFSADRYFTNHKDSVHLKWTIRGKPSLSFSENKTRNFKGDTITIYEYRLVALKGSKKSDPSIVQVTLLTPNFRDFVILNVIDKEGDTLVACGNKDTAIYHDIRISSISSLDKRPLFVNYKGIQAIVSDSNKINHSLDGLNYAGYWELRSVMTPSEKLNPAIIPNTFSIAVYIQSTKL